MCWCCNFQRLCNFPRIEQEADFIVELAHAKQEAFRKKSVLSHFFAAL